MYKETKLRAFISLAAASSAHLHMQGKALRRGNQSNSAIIELNQAANKRRTEMIKINKAFSRITDNLTL